ncbi:DUF4259 domain-containing protein [Cellulomonas sp. URHB0016]
MGAWGSGIFDNDTAADWAGGLDDAEAADRPALVRTALLAAVEADDDLDLDDASVALAAAAVVAAGLPDGPDVNHNYGPDVETLVGLRLDPGEVDLALRAVDRVVAEGSEWRELWEEADSLDEACGAIEPVVAALRGHAGGSAPA